METKFIFALLAALFLLLGCAAQQPSPPASQPPAQQTVSGQQPQAEDPGVVLVPEIDDVTVDEGE